MDIPTTEVWGGGVTRRFVIPLSMLSVFADTCDQLIPAQLASGLRFELLMEDAQVALKAASATDIPGYEVTAASLNLSSYILSDVVLRTINESSASSGKHPHHTNTIRTHTHAHYTQVWNWCIRRSTLQSDSELERC